MDIKTAGYVLRDPSSDWTQNVASNVKEKDHYIAPQWWKDSWIPVSQNVTYFASSDFLRL